MDKKDHALAIVKAGLSTLPIVGGPLASLIGDYIPSATQRTVERALQSLERKLEELGGRIDYANINKDEFSEIFKSSYYTIVRTHQQRKIDLAVSLIANTLLNRADIAKLSFNEADHFSRCIEQLSTGAFEVLGEATATIRDANNIRQEHELDPRYMQAYQFEFGLLKLRFTDYDPSLLMGLIGELDSFNLLHRKGIPEIPTPDYGNYPLELTRLGLRFVHFLMSNPRPFC